MMDTSAEGIAVVRQETAGLVRAGTPLERLGISDVRPELCAGKSKADAQRSRPLALFVAVKPAHVADALIPYAQLLRQSDAVASFAAGTVVLLIPPTK